MPPGVLEPQAGGCIAVPGGKDKKTGQNRSGQAKGRGEGLSLAGGPFRRAAGKLGFRRLGLELGLKLGFERGNPDLERLVFLARQPGHVLDRLELLALDHVEIAEDALGLMAQHRVELAPHALGDAGRVVHQPRRLVKEPIAGLCHRRLRANWSDCTAQTMAIAPRNRKGRIFKLIRAPAAELDFAFLLAASRLRPPRLWQLCRTSSCNFPPSTRCWSRSGRSRSVGMRLRISPASCSDGSTHGR